MSILLSKNTKVICQGITGRAGMFHTQKCMEYGTRMVGGVVPGKGGTSVLDLPIFNTVSEAKSATGANATMIFVPATHAIDACLEAIESDIELIVLITEGIPVLDMIKIKKYLQSQNKAVRLIGPNCPGIITPGVAKIGIMPGNIHLPGKVGVVSRSGTLTYEAVKQLTQLGIGQSTCVGIGGDPVYGENFMDVLELFQKDIETEAVVMIGEIGGNAELRAGDWIKKNMNKPVISFIAGQTAPKDKRMGHAGAIISGNKETAQKKYEFLAECGVHTVKSPADIGITTQKVLKGGKSIFGI